MVKRENQARIASERRQIADDIKVAIQRFWFTEQGFLQKPTIHDEQRNVTHYLKIYLPFRTSPAQCYLLGYRGR